MELRGLQNIAESHDHLVALAHGLDIGLADSGTDAALLHCFPVDGSTHEGGQVAQQGLHVFVPHFLVRLGVRGILRSPVAASELVQMVKAAQ